MSRQYGLMSLSIANEIGDALRLATDTNNRYPPSSWPDIIRNLSANYDLPDYEKTYIDSKISQIKTKIANASATTAIFGYFSDAHMLFRDSQLQQVEGNAGHTGEIMRYIMLNTGIKRWVFGGDALAYEDTQTRCQDSFDTVRNWFKTIDGKIIVKGNHDLNPYGSPQLTDAQYKSMFFSQVMGSDYTYPYYYIDEPKTKTRYIILDTRKTSIQDSYTNGDTTEKAYVAAEVEWLYTTLNSTPNGYQIIVFPHEIWWGGGRMAQGYLTLSEGSGTELIQLMGYYNSRSSGTMYGKAYNFANAVGHVAIVISGHTHIDYSRTYENVVATSITSDSYAYANDRPDSVLHTKGTPTEHALDIWFVDYTNGTAETIRIGCGNDRQYAIGTNDNGQICHITKGLTNCTSSSATTTAKNSYTTTLTATEGNFQNGIYSVKCNGYDVTNATCALSNNNQTLTITVNPLPGNLVIAAEAALTPIYTITYNLSHCTLSNNATTIQYDTTYTSTITVDSGYEITSMEIFEGGTDITSTSVSNNTITIPAIAGNIEINIIAEEVVSYTNQICISQELASTDIYNSGRGYKNGYYASVGNESANAADCITGLIPYVIQKNVAQPTDIIYIKGYTGTANASHTRMSLWDTSKVYRYEQNGFLANNSWFNIELIGTNYYKLTPKSNLHHSVSYDIGYIRLSFNQADGKDIAVTINEIIEPITYYTVTKNLINCTASNATTTVDVGDSYSCTITASSGYNLSSITVTMGGIDITSLAVSNGTISIGEVTGPVVVTAIADDPSAGNNLIRTSQAVDSVAIYNNGLGYKNGYYISGSEEHSNAADCCTGLIPYTIGSSQPTDVIYIKGYTGQTSAGHTRISLWDSLKAHKSTYNGFLDNSNIPFTVTTLGTDYYQLTPKTGAHHNFSCAYLRFSFNQANASSIIITKNEPIS